MLQYLTSNLIRGVGDDARIHYPSCTDSRFVYFTTAGVKCCVAAVKSCPVLHFSVVIFFWSFGIIDASTIKCWELSTAYAGARGVRDVARNHYPSFIDSINRVCNSRVILLWLLLPRDHFVSIFLIRSDLFPYVSAPHFKGYVIWLKMIVNSIYLF
jgi:hypothetical protein